MDDGDGGVDDDADADADGCCCVYVHEGCWALSQHSITGMINDDDQNDIDEDQWMMIAKMHHAGADADDGDDDDDDVSQLRKMSPRGLMLQLPQRRYPRLHALTPPPPVVVDI
eukprot:1769339-Karenia_brevis.AAC.1